MLKVKLGQYMLGARQAVQGVFFGSIAFAIIDLGVALTKNFPEAISFELIFLPIYFLIVALSITLLSLIPGILGGVVVQFFLIQRKMFPIFSNISGGLIGGLVGAFAGMLIGSAIVYFEYRLVSSTGHGSVSVALERSIYGSLIAILAGAWAGNQIDKALEADSPF